MNAFGFWGYLASTKVFNNLVIKINPFTALLKMAVFAIDTKIGHIPLHGKKRLSNFES